MKNGKAIGGALCAGEVNGLTTRYVVIKIDDLQKYASALEAGQLMEICKKITEGRREDGKTEWTGLCLANDWPEFEQVKEMILRRINSPEYQNGKI